MLSMGVCMNLIVLFMQRPVASVDTYARAGAGLKETSVS